MRKSSISLILQFFTILTGLFAFTSHALSQDSTVIATRISTPPVIDGILNESVWKSGVPVTRFTQSEPVEYGTPSQKTEVTVLYDDHALYVGARMLDTATDSIVGVLARRDANTESDLFILSVDPYHDHRSGSYFGLTAAGSRFDGVRFNDSWSDDSWDGVWEGAVARNTEGWSAELRIPFSQLHFNQQKPMIWGFNFKRYISRRSEYDFLVFTPKNESGFVSRFWHLVGMDSIPQPHYAEFLPYVRGKASHLNHEKGDPFTHPWDATPAAGIDVKIGVGSNLVLNGTVNPDFGQVEVDPAVLNLSDVETYYNEKRPFFIEGSKNFEYGYGGSNDYWSFNWSGPDFFYSRRIGRSPQGSLPDYDYVDVPEGAHILSAAKLTGKLNGNWNVGSLHAITIREHAQIEYEGNKSEVEIEPATYYTVNRAQKDIQNGFRGIGGIFTTTHRFFDEQQLKDDINSDAFTGGLDGWSFLDKDQTYVITGWSGLSHVRGSKERMTALQRNSRHYYQRPDASHVEVDSNATSLTGYAGRFLLNKQKGNVLLNSAFGFISPGFEVNDLGFLYRADALNFHLGSGYQWTKPTSWYRYANIVYSIYGSSDFGGHTTGSGVWGKTNLNFTNYYGIQIWGGYCPQTTSISRTRGGPLMKNTAGWESNASAYSDSRNPVVFNIGTYGSNSASQEWNRSLWLSAEWKPASNVSVTLSPEMYWAKDPLAWVDSFDDPLAEATYGKRYVFAYLWQTQLSSSVRLNWTFTPRLSLQFYAQPLISSGSYKNFKELSKPNSNDVRIYPDNDITYNADDEEYTIDPDGSGPAESISFSQPDFDYTSLRGNVILRWEYLPGSTFYFVWTHGREDSESRGQFNMSRSFGRVFERYPDDVFLVKATYWFNM